MIMVKTLRLFLVAALAMVFGNVMAEEVTMAYPSGSTTNMTGNNDAALVGLDAKKWSVVGAKGGHSNFPGLNQAGDIRLYYHASGSNTITVESLEGATINSITITFNGDTYSNVTVTANGSAVTGNEGTYAINSSSFVLGNGNTTNVQVRIKSIVINYSASSDTRTATSIEFSGDYLTKFTSGKDGVSTNLPTATVKAGDAAVAGAAITWTITKGTGWNEEVTIPTISGNTITNIENSSYGDLTIKASYEGGTSYKPSSKTYTLKMYKGRMNIKEILEDFDKLGDKNWNNGVQTSYWQVDEISENNVVPKEALVTYVKNSYTYIKDNDGSLLLYGSNLGYKQGDIITGDLGNSQFGTIYGSLKTYSGLLELVTQKDECEFIVKSSDNPVEPTTITAAQLDKSKMNEYLKIENAVYATEFTSNNATFKVGEKEFTVRNAFGLSDDELKALAVGETYTLVGMGAMYNTTPQLYLISATSTSGINELKAANAKFEGKTYNVAGQAVNKGYKGLVIMNGRKFINK